MRSEHNARVEYESPKVEEAIINYLLYAHFSPKNGARSLDEPIKKHYAGPLYDFIMSSGNNRKVIVDFDKNRLIFKVGAQIKRENEGILVLTALEKYIVSTINRELSQKSENEPILDEEIAEWLAPRPVAEPKNTLPVSFSGTARVFRAKTNDFFSRGRRETLTSAKIREIVEEQRQFIPDPETIDAIFDWLVAGLDILRRMNLEQAMTDAGNLGINDFSGNNLKSSQAVYQPYVPDADQKYFAELVQDIDEGNNEAVFAARFNSGLSKMLYRLLFEQDWTDEEQIFGYCQKNNLKALFPIISLTHKLRERGITSGYGLQDRTGVLWLKVKTPQLNAALGEISVLLQPDAAKPGVAALPEEKPFARQKKIEKLLSQGESIPGIAGEITAIWNPSIFEDRIAVSISAGGLGYLISRKGNNPWQKLLSQGESIPGIAGEITAIWNPSIFEDRIAVWIRAGGLGYLISRKGNNPWQKLLSQGESIPGIAGKITDIWYPSIFEDRIAVKISAGGQEHLIIVSNLGPEIVSVSLLSSPPPKEAQEEPLSSLSEKSLPGKNLKNGLRIMLRWLGVPGKVRKMKIELKRK